MIRIIGSIIKRNDPRKKPSLWCDVEIVVKTENPYHFLFQTEKNDPRKNHLCGVMSK